MTTLSYFAPSVKRLILFAVEKFRLLEVLKNIRI